MSKTKWRIGRRERVVHARARDGFGSFLAGCPHFIGLLSLAML
jgi:hypothetical protein